MYRLLTLSLCLCMFAYSPCVSVVYGKYQNPKIICKITWIVVTASTWTTRTALKVGYIESKPSIDDASEWEWERERGITTPTIAHHDNEWCLLSISPHTHTLAAYPIDACVHVYTVLYIYLWFLLVIVVGVSKWS